MLQAAGTAGLLITHAGGDRDKWNFTGDFKEAEAKVEGGVDKRLRNLWEGEAGAEPDRDDPCVGESVCPIAKPVGRFCEGDADG